MDFICLTMLCTYVTIIYAVCDDITANSKFTVVDRRIMNRFEYEKFITEKYNVKSEYLWESAPSFAVYRHKLNRKWFAVVMRIGKSKIGIDEPGEIDIVNLKCPPEIMFDIQHEQGIYPAYHMNKKHWCTVLLDGSVEDAGLEWLTENSYIATLKKNK